MRKLKRRVDRLASYPALLRIGIFVFTLLGLWAPLAGLILGWVRDANIASILTLTLLYAEFIILVRLWGRYVYKQPALLNHYGLVKTRKNGVELLAGLAIGLTSLLLMFSLQGLIGWIIWRPLQPLLFWRVLEGLLTGIGIGFAEELLFRGWLLDELQRDYSQRRALWASAIVFALLHAPSSIAQVPALVLLGATLVWSKAASQGRLGLAIGLHGGLVWGYYIVNVGQLVSYSNRVPSWLTGINGNPLAGGVGILALGAIAIAMRHAAYRSQRQ